MVPIFDLVLSTQVCVKKEATNISVRNYVPKVGELPQVGKFWKKMAVLK